MTQDQATFLQLVTGGTPLVPALPAVLARLISASDATPMDPLASTMLGLPDGSTYLVGATLVQSRITAGLAPF